MESNLLEIKRFLNDHKKNVFIGSIIISIIFAVSLFFLNTLKTDVPKDGQESFEPTAEEILNDGQPAYFQIYVEREDGTSYGNPYIINQYFNKNSVKEEAQKATGIDIKIVEKEVYLNDLNDEIKVINVARNEESYLLTASFNLGNERNNLKLAEYYYDILFSNDFTILQDKNVYIFEKPQIVQTNEIELALEKLEEERKLESYSSLANIVEYTKSIIIGFTLGIFIMIGLALLKVIFGKTLDYSFGYDLEEDDKFILSDVRLQNEQLVSQFVAAPFDSHKVVVSEANIAQKDLELLSANEHVTFSETRNDNMLLTEITSLSELDLVEDISEVIIIIYPKITTRKWYGIQKQFAKINALPTKVIQINK